MDERCSGRKKTGRMSESFPQTGSLPLDLERRVDELCDEFEGALKRNIVPETAEYLARIPGTAHSQLLRELAKLLDAYLVKGETASSHANRSTNTAHRPAAEQWTPV